MKPKLLIILILFVLSLSTKAQNDTLLLPRKWELSFKMQYSQYKIDYSHYSPSFTNRVYDLPQFEIGIRRNFNINNKLTAALGFSYRYMPFLVEYGYSDSNHINLFDPKDNRYFNKFESINFSLLFKYHIARLNNIKLISVYSGFNYSRFGYSKGSNSYKTRFYDKENNVYLNYQIYQKYYTSPWSDNYFNFGASDYSFVLGMDLYFNSRVKLFTEIIYYPKEILLLKYGTSISASWYARPEAARVYRPKLFYGLGVSYLF